MIRLNWSTRPLIALMMVAIGSGTLTAGVFDVFKSNGKKPGQNAVVRGQEPNPAPPAPLEEGDDPAYARPALPAPMTQPLPPVSTPLPAGQTPDCAPQYSGFSDGSSCHACLGCREPASCCCCDQYSYKMGRASRRLSGQSYYCDCYPLFGPRYGFYTTCWRRLPEDCRCPILLPPRKSRAVSEPIPTDDSAPTLEPQIPPPPQALNFR